MTCVSGHTSASYTNIMDHKPWWRWSVWSNGRFLSSSKEKRRGVFQLCEYEPTVTFTAVKQWKNCDRNCVSVMTKALDSRRHYGLFVSFSCDVFFMILWCCQQSINATQMLVYLCLSAIHIRGLRPVLTSSEFHLFYFSTWIKV